MKMYKALIFFALAAVTSADSDSGDDGPAVLKTNTKCQQGQGRLFKSLNVETAEDCIQECRDNMQCNFVSYKPTGQYKKMCIGCGSEENFDGHNGFVMYAVPNNGVDDSEDDSEDDSDSGDGATARASAPDTCAATLVNKKCPYDHRHRLFRTPDGAGVTVKQCQELCDMTDGCDFYSYAFSWHPDYPSVCMGCTSDEAVQTHHGFHLYSKDCIGVPPPGSRSGSAGHLCAKGTGDPHFTTFDGLKYDCQGEGDYILSKSLDSGFELQGRFEKVPGKSVTTHQGAVITTGFADEPKVEVAYSKQCDLSYTIGERTVDLEGDENLSSDTVEFIRSGKTRSFVFNSGFTMKVTLRAWRGDCLLNVYLCVPEAVASENIVGILGSPDGNMLNDFTDRIGTDLNTAGKTTKKESHEQCVETWCIPQVDDNLFAVPGETHAGCTVPFDDDFAMKVVNADPDIKAACGDNEACIVDTIAADGDVKVGLQTLDDEEEDPEPPTPDEIEPPTLPMPAPPNSGMDDPAPQGRSAGGDDSAKKTALTSTKGSGSGDPHFMTWSAEKYDYHGECDLVLLDHPAFGNGKGMRVHIRTTRVSYFSYIEKVALKIGDDLLEFDNDVENFLINGNVAEPNVQHHKTMLGDYRIRRDRKHIAVLLHDEGMNAKGHPKVVFHQRKNGFPAVIVDGGNTDVFKGSLGLLGDWETGKKLARDGKTEIEVKDTLDAREMAFEWQVRDTEPSLFQETRFPQFPTTCTPPAQRAPNRLRHSQMQKDAEEACAHWKMDKEDCIFDVIATRDTLVAHEGHIVHLE